MDVKRNDFFFQGATPLRTNKILEVRMKGTNSFHIQNMFFFIIIILDTRNLRIIKSETLLEENCYEQENRRRFEETPEEYYNCPKMC